jgi:hypothetical protein
MRHLTLVLLSVLLAPLALPFALGAATLTLGVLVLEWMDRSVRAARARERR